MNESVNEQEIDLKRLFNALKHNWILIVAITLVLAIIGFLVTYFLIDPEYQAEVRAVVDVGSSSAVLIDGNYIDPTSITTSRNFVQLFELILKSSSCLNPVVEELNSEGYDFTYEKLYKIVDIASVNDTQVLSITVTHTDKELALNILDKIYTRVPEILQQALENGSFITIDNPRYVNEGEPVSPSIIKNTAICAVIGFVLIVAIVIIREIFNTTIKDEADIEKYLGLPIIGKIPKMDTKGGFKNGH